MVYQGVRRACGPAAVRPRLLDPASLAMLAFEGHFAQGVSAYETVLVLGDLGAHGSEADRRRWRRTGLRLRRLGARPIALVPSPQQGPWDTISWVSKPRSGVDGAVERLISLLAPIEFIQPGLLRSLRAWVPGAGLREELKVWNHEDVQAADSTGLVLKPEALPTLRAAFAKLEEPTQEKVAGAIEHWHEKLPVELLHIESLAWQTYKTSVSLGDFDAALEFLERVVTTLSNASKQSESAWRRFANTALKRLPEAKQHSEKVAPVLKRLFRAANRYQDYVEVPASVGAALHNEHSESPTQLWSVHQVGADLLFAPCKPACPPLPGSGSPLAWVSAAEPRVSVLQQGEHDWLHLGRPVRLKLGDELRLITDRSKVKLARWERPKWAVAAGRDRYGLWAEFAVAEAQHRLRWIPPGQFWMGSPEEEEGRYESEGPQRLVTLTQGYWLAETAVTQALWTAVMGDNPSRFIDPDRPVENVSWEDTQRFFERLYKEHGFRAHLPSEAQWERACRAGTNTATWIGDLKILGENNAPILDAIAWYRGNCGVGFDLSNGYNSSGWPEKQHDHQRAGSRKVKSKAVNPFGLYDMLGNVWEWCQDYWGSYQANAAIDPQGPEFGAKRVFRGGSWYGLARVARAAFRVWSLPGIRDVYLGFRLARDQ